jgi:AcrR family transcriptional regulator
MRTKTNERREAILATAKQVFEECGFEQANMAVIAERMGSSKATLYRYFESKEALFQALLQRSAATQGGDFKRLLWQNSEQLAVDSSLPAEALEVIAGLDPAADVATTLKLVSTQLVQIFYTPERYATTRMIIAASTNAEVGRMFYEQGYRVGIKFFEDYFARLIQAGRLREADPRIVACHFRALVESEVNNEGLFNILPPLTDAQITGFVDRAIDVFMRAYAV